MGNKLINKIKRNIVVGSLALAGVFSYSGQKFEPTSPENSLLYTHPISEYAKMISTNYITNVNKSTPFEKAKEQYEIYQKSELEKILNEEKKQKKEVEKRKFLESYYLSQDSLNSYIRQAYSNVKKWPNEFDKRLFRVMLRQESSYNVHAVSKSGYKGLGQIGPEVYQTFRPEKFEALKDSITGQIDEHALQKELFNPTTNLELSLEYLNYISKFCAKYDPNWSNSDLETKRKKILFAYNAGVGTARKYNFNHNNKKLPRENREYPEKIMNAYHDSNLKIKT